MAHWTFDKLIKGRETVTAYCETNLCHHSAALDLITLRDRFGGNHSAMAWDINPRLRCTVCGKKNATIRLTPGTKEYGGNPYLKSKGK
jgi:hypothetical protein